MAALLLVVLCSVWVVAVFLPEAADDEGPRGEWGGVADGPPPPLLATPRRTLRRMGDVLRSSSFFSSVVGFLALMARFRLLPLLLLLFF